MNSSVILDQYGNPVMVSKADLKERLAAPSVFGLRNPQRTTNIAAQLTPARLRHILQITGSQGDMEEYAEIAEEVEERDPHYRSVLSQRKQAVASRKWEVSPVSDHPQDQRIAEFAREILATPEFSRACFDLLDGIAKGYALIEILWRANAGILMPASYQWVDTRWILFDRNDGRTPLLVTADGGNQAPEMRSLNRTSAMALPFAKFIWHTPTSKSGLPSRGGIVHSILPTYMLKNYALRDWWAYQEVHGIPLRVGKYDASASQDDIDELIRGIANIASDAGCVIPRSMEIEFVNSQKGGGETGAAIFEKAVRWCDETISKGILGQTMTSEAGSSRAQAEVHYAVRDDIISDDAKQLAQTVQQELIAVAIHLNFGVGVAIPDVRLNAPMNEDKNELAKRAQIAQAMGLPLSKSSLYASLGLKPPTDDADTLAATQNLVAGDEPPAAAGEENAATPTLWESIAASDLTDLQSLLNSADSTADFFKAAAAAGYNKQLAQALAIAGFEARVAGEQGDDINE